MLVITDTAAGLVIEGELDLDTAMTFVNTVKAHIKAGATLRCIFAGVSACDQAGIAGIILTVRAARRLSCKLKLQKLSANVMTLLKLLNLTTILQPELGSAE